MIPETMNGLNAMECVSAMQKCIRRSLEREAMEFACELLHTSKAFLTLVCNRLEVITHEDIDTMAAPHVVPFIAAASQQARERYKPDAPGEARLIVGNMIRLLCRAPKSRAGCHFAAAIGLRALFDAYVPKVPDWARDVHTQAGKRMGRGLHHFRSEGALLCPAPTEHDPYEDEAYQLWERKYAAKK